MYIADLHIHSKYSRATSHDGDAQHLDLWARNKGIYLLGTGDFTHPGWRAELRDALIPAEDGLYRLRDDYRMKSLVGDDRLLPRFVISGEISSIYKKKGKTRKVHNLILLPGLEAADALSQRLELIGNIRSDGRPILGLDSKDLLEITLDVCPEAVFIPAHIWTPHFSLFGAFSGFDCIEDCFEDLTGEIHALETGLSSDPAMNWRISALDRFTLVSNSDAHSPAKLGREANLLDTELSYMHMCQAISTGERFAGTIEFFPEEGKYHLDGHRNCQIRLTPEETVKLSGICPVCGRKLTIGVDHRVWEMADRPEGFRPDQAKPYVSLVPLQELIASAIGSSVSGRKTIQVYERLLHSLGPELSVLREIPISVIEQEAGVYIAEGIRRLREGKVKRRPGYDGEYGVISVFDPAERAELMGQTSLFSGFGESKPEAVSLSNPAVATQSSEQEGERLIQPLNQEQQAAVGALDRVIAVIAGPGTGKTKTLVARIAHLIEDRGVKPSQITAVTFTNQAAKEMRERLEARLGGKKAVKDLTIGTFHAICLSLLDEKLLLAEDESQQMLRDILLESGVAISPAEASRRISKVKSGLTCLEAGIDQGVYEIYCRRCQDLGMRDLDDLLLDALRLDYHKQRCFTHLLVDEFQDINAVQRQLVRRWAKECNSLFVIGDPDQSIYGFRGADSKCFSALGEDFPETRTILLQQNYRSTPEIIANALQLINHNPGAPRYLNPNRPKGTRVSLWHTESEFAEGIAIAREIAGLTGGMDMLDAQRAHSERSDAPRAFSEIAVLCRTRRQLELIESCLRHDSIPCVIAGRGKELADDLAQGMIAFFRCLINPQDSVALQRVLSLIWQTPQQDIDLFISRAAEHVSFLDLPEEQIPAVLLTAYREYLPLIKRQKSQQLLARWIDTYARGNESCRRLLETAVFYDRLPDFLRTLVLGEEADILRSLAKSYPDGAVRLMTLHGAKGLEFPVVFLAGLSEGVLPLTHNGEVSDLEEERRLLFVGMTRAQERLILSYNTNPSCFVRELSVDLDRRTVSSLKQRPAAKQLSLF